MSVCSLSRQISPPRGPVTIQTRINLQSTAVDDLANPPTTAWTYRPARLNLMNGRIYRGRVRSGYPSREPGNDEDRDRRKVLEKGGKRTEGKTGLMNRGKDRGRRRDATEVDWAQEKKTQIASDQVDGLDQRPPTMRQPCEIGPVWDGVHVPMMGQTRGRSEGDGRPIVCPGDDQEEQTTHPRSKQSSPLSW